MKKVTVYTIDPCPYCTQAKSLLQSKGVSFEEVRVQRDDDAMREALLRKSGMRTFPQIFFGDELVGGYAELKRLEDTHGILKALGRS